MVFENFKPQISGIGKFRCSMLIGEVCGNNDCKEMTNLYEIITK